MTDSFSIQGTKMTDTAIAHFAKALPSAVKSRMLIDMVNCLDVADDHLRVKERRQSFFPRMFDFFSGQGGRRDAAIAQSQQTTLREVVNVTTKLARELSNTNLALAEVGGRLGAVERLLAQVTHLALDQRQALDALAKTVESERLRVDERLQTLDLRVAAHEQLGLVFKRWAAGDFRHLPLASRASAALQELRWGVFGEFLARRPQEAQTLRESAIKDTAIRLQADIREENMDANDPLGLRAWLSLPGGGAQQPPQTRAFLEGLDWLGGSVALDGPQGVLKVCSQWPLLERKEDMALPLKMPRLATAERMAALLADAALAPLAQQREGEGA